MDALAKYSVEIIFVACLLIGFLIKGIDKIPNKYIPLIVGVLGVVFNVWLNAWAFSLPIMVGGLASGWAATGGFETVKQIVTNGDTATPTQ